MPGDFVTVKNLKNGIAFEKLNVLVNSLINVRNENVIKYPVNIKLSLEKVKNALDELLGGKNSIADVILSENLFSQILSQEAKSSLNCAKKIQSLVKNELLKKPIIIVTSLNESILVLIILPKEFQDFYSSHNGPVIYSIDPWTGTRNLLDLTQNKLLQGYLLNGSKGNGIGEIFKPNIEILENVSSVDKCKNLEDSGWLVIYYCLMVIRDGNDKFLNEKLNWSSIDIDAIKTILVAHVEIFSKIEKEKVVHFKPKYDLHKLTQVEEDLLSLYHERKQEIQRKIDNLNELCIEEQLKKLIDDEIALKKSCEIMSNEISEIEKVIKDGESLLSLNKNDKTIEERFQKFITGEERRILEMKIDKKSEKSKESILMHNENERTKIYKNQLEQLENDLKIEDDKIVQNKAKIEEIFQKISLKQSEIKQIESNIEKNKNNLAQLETNGKNYEQEETLLKNIQSELNQINVDHKFDLLINRLLKSDIECDKNQIKSIENNLKKCNDNIQNLTSSLNDYGIKLEKNNERISDLRVLIDNRNSKISGLNSDVSKANSTINSMVTEKNEKTGFFSSWWHSNRLKELENLIDEWERKRNGYNSSINENNKEINSFKTEIDSLENSNNKLRSDKVRDENSLNTEKNQRQGFINTLKSTKDELVKKYIEKIQTVSKQKLDNNISIQTNKKNDGDFKESITRIEKEILRLNKEHENVELSLGINHSTRMNILQEINKIKANLQNTEFMKQNKEPVKVQPKDVLLQNKLIDSQIITDQQYEQLLDDPSVCMKIDNQYQKFKLLYRASRDGFDSKKFHELCDGKSNTLVFIKTINSRIFGGFTGASWSTTDGFKDDPYAFIFSLANSQNKQTIIKCSDSANAIYCDKNNGPCFGDGDIKITNMSNINEKSESVLGYTYGEELFEYRSQESMTFLAGSQNFQVQDIEVFCKDFYQLTQSELNSFAQMAKKDYQTILQSYETFHTLAVNGKISLPSFINFLVNMIHVFKNKEELKNMKSLFTFIFHHFDEDHSGELEFNEFIKCFCIFDNKNKQDMPSLFLEICFDYADKDKSQTLDIDELNDLFNQFPLMFKKNQQIKSFMRKLERKKVKVLTKEEFLSVLEENKKLSLSFDESDLLDKSLIDSVIIENNHQFNDLVSLCKMENQKFKLIYRASRDGFKSEDFHQKCDNHANTLTIIKTVNSAVFGGYSSAAWSSDEEFRLGKVSFLFSLLNNRNEKKLIECENHENAIKCSKEYGPCFGQNDLLITSSSNLNEKSCSVLGKSYGSSMFEAESKDVVNFLADSEFFQVEEIEVFVKVYPSLNKNEISYIEKEYGIPNEEILNFYHYFHAIAINGEMDIDKFLSLISEEFDCKLDNEICLFMKNIMLYFDEDKTGKLSFNDFLKCLTVLDFESDKFFKFLFDFADKDKNQKLDENEIKEIFTNMPKIILDGNGLEIALRKLAKKNNKNKFLDKDEFLKIVHKIKYNCNKKNEEMFYNIENSQYEENDNSKSTNGNYGESSSDSDQSTDDDAVTEDDEDTDDDKWTYDDAVTEDDEDTDDDKWTYDESTGDNIDDDDDGTSNGEDGTNDEGTDDSQRTDVSKNTNDNEDYEAESSYNDESN
ncbi:unnamed protein product [Brachionus calyciflorus]|uniref:Uncharacterized protein n=1 Tax=Brachionus calyciflorus TaxID=104777 RepID=A0A813M5Q5_9BILA|nr:unnamed protein product [Brachionus calyciflorus]